MDLPDQCEIDSYVPVTRSNLWQSAPVLSSTHTLSSSVAACNRRWSVICCCRPQALEHSAWRHYICAVLTGVPTKIEDSFVSAILSGHYIV